MSHQQGHAGLLGARGQSGAAGSKVNSSSCISLYLCCFARLVSKSDLFLFEIAAHIVTLSLCVILKGPSGTPGGMGPPGPAVGHNQLVN